MSPLYAWERSTWDSHPSRVLLRPSCARRPRRLALRISTLLAASFNPLPSSASSLAPSVIPSQVSVRPIFRPSIYLSIFLSLSIPPFAALPRRVSAGTHTRRTGAHREPKTKFSATSPPSMVPITRCSRDEIERPRRFSAPAATILRRM